MSDADIEEQNKVKSRRGARARQKGNQFERDCAAMIGGVRKGMFGGKVDIENDWMVAQLKCGNGTYSERYDGWLRSVKGNASQISALIVGDAPGPGTRRRTMIVLDFEDFIALMGTNR